MLVVARLFSPENRLLHDRSAALAACQLAFDGPLPQALREAVANGGVARLDRLQRIAESRAMDRMAGACGVRVAAGRHEDAAPMLERDLARLRAVALTLREGDIA